MNKGRHAPAASTASRPRGPGWCVAAPPQRVRKTGLPGKANEDTSGFAPGFGNGVPMFAKLVCVCVFGVGI